MSLADELTLASTQYIQCKVCRFLVELPEAERAEWVRELSAPGPHGGYLYTSFAVMRVLNARGVVVKDDAVRSHRRNHGQPA